MTVTRLVVFGPTGQVGTELLRSAGTFGHEVIPISRGDLDLREPLGLERRLIGANPTIVVNAAAYTAVDAAESDPDTAFLVNREAPAHLAKACERLGIPFIHLSTDYVFDGQAHLPYRETDPVAPLGVYGLSKWEGECAVRASCRRHLIIRTAWVYAAHGKNFLRTMLKLGKERPHLRIVNDQRGSPTAASDIAKMLHQIIAKIGTGGGSWGIFHFTNKGEATWYDFARAIFAQASSWYGAGPELIPIPSAAYPTPARRPLYSVLECSHIEKTFGIVRRPWEMALADVMSELKAMTYRSGV